MHYTKIRSHPIRNECTLVLCADQGGGGGIIKLQNKKPQTPPPGKLKYVYLNNQMLIHAGYDIAEIF